MSGDGASNAAERKFRIREEVKRRLESLDDAYREGVSEAILEKILSTRWWTEAELVLTYLSTDTEVSTDRMVDEAYRADRKSVV